MSRTLVPMRFGRVVATRVGPNKWVKTSGHRFQGGNLQLSVSLNNDGCVVINQSGSASLSVSLDNNSCVVVS